MTSKSSPYEITDEKANQNIMKPKSVKLHPYTFLILINKKIALRCQRKHIGHQEMTFLFLYYGDDTP